LPQGASDVVTPLVPGSTFAQFRCRRVRVSYRQHRGIRMWLLRMSPLFRGLRRFVVYLVCRGAGPNCSKFQQANKRSMAVCKFATSLTVTGTHRVDIPAFTPFPGDCCSIAWNALPSSVRSAPSLLQFRRELKTALRVSLIVLFTIVSSWVTDCNF